MIDKIILGTGIFGGVTYVLKQQMEYAIKNEIYPDVDLENTRVSVHLATLNEQYSIVDTLKSLVQQRLYQENRDKIELVLVDSHSDDLTVELAERWVDRVLIVPKGKLTARREAIEQSPDADIIVSVDSGDSYPPNFYHLLLRWFSNPEVVAVAGSEVSVVGTPLHIQVAVVWSNYLLQRLPGRGMAMRRNAFFECDGWDESVNQQNIHEIWMEEEFELYNKMSRMGKVIHDFEAVVYCPPRRFQCNGEMDELIRYCSAIREGQRF